VRRTWSDRTNTPTAPLIVGGGLGGLTAALALARAGIRSHVLEKADDFVELGAGLQLAPNATRILADLGIFDKVAEVAVFPSRLVLRDAVGGGIVTELDAGEPLRRHFGHPYLVMHRHDLLSILLDACKEAGVVQLDAGREVIAVDQDQAAVEVTCADGSRYRGPALIGADGVRSFLRTVLSDDALVHDHFVAYRGTLARAQAPAGARFDQMLFWIGPDFHFVQYPIRRGELFNQVAVFRSDRYQAASDDWGTPDELEEHFRPACAAVKAGLRTIRRDRRWPMVHRPPISNWTAHRLTLLGDAAHPMLQYIAQGACQAIEDAHCLAAELQRHLPDVEAAFAAYQAERAPRTARVQQTAQLWGEIIHVDGIGKVLRDALLGPRRADDYEPLEWLYGYGRETTLRAPPMARPQGGVATAARRDRRLT